LRASRLVQQLKHSTAKGEGKRSQVEHAREQHPDFQCPRWRHSAIESAINAASAACPPKGQAPRARC
jgi:hypothetical protein